jgi:SSS family solute:Na+ symporter
MAGIVVGFLITTAFTLLWPHPMGIHAGFWGLLINLPVFITVSLLTPATSADVVERFFRISAPRGFKRLKSNAGE